MILNIDEILRMFRENFPFVSREEEALAEVIGHEGNILFARRNPEGKLIACAMVNGQTILLLVVDQDYRGQGIGSGLLSECEDAIRRNGFNRAILGVGFNYLMPGVPTNVMSRYTIVPCPTMISVQPSLTREASITRLVLPAT